MATGIWIFLISFVVFTIICVVLLKIGKKVKQNEAQFEQMFKEEAAKANLRRFKKKYSGSGYKKAPSIDKRYRK